MKKISTEELTTSALESYLDGILSCFDFGDIDLDRYVTGKSRDLLEKLPESEWSYAIGRALGAVDHDCIKCFPWPQKDYEFFLPPTELEIDITHLELEEPDDFYIREVSGRKLAYCAMEYGASIALDLNRLEEYVQDYLTDQKN